MNGARSRPGSRRARPPPPAPTPRPPGCPTTRPAPSSPFPAPRSRRTACPPAVHAARTSQRRAERAAQQTERDPLRTLEAHGLDRGRRQPAGGREVRRQRHVAAALPDLELVLHRAGRAPEVRARDHVEDGLRRGGDRAREGTQRACAAADAEIECQRAAHDQDVDPRAERAARAGGASPASLGRCVHLWRRLAHSSKPITEVLQRADDRDMEPVMPGRWIAPFAEDLASRPGPAPSSPIAKAARRVR